MGLCVAIEKSQENARGNPAIRDLIARDPEEVKLRNALVSSELRFARACPDETCLVCCEGVADETKARPSSTEEYVNLL